MADIERKMMRHLDKYWSERDWQEKVWVIVLVIVPLFIGFAIGWYVLAPIILWIMELL